MTLLLPEEIWVYIIRLIPLPDFGTISQVCRLWRYLVREETEARIARALTKGKSFVQLVLKDALFEGGRINYEAQIRTTEEEYTLSKVAEDGLLLDVVQPTAETVVRKRVFLLDLLFPDDCHTFSSGDKYAFRLRFKSESGCAHRLSYKFSAGEHGYPNLAALDLAEFRIFELCSSHRLENSKSWFWFRYASVRKISWIDKLEFSIETFDRCAIDQSDNHWVTAAHIDLKVHSETLRQRITNFLS
jgi:hypothetical protein